MKRLTLTMLVRDENEQDVTHWLQVAIDAVKAVGVRDIDFTTASMAWAEDEWRV